MESLGKDVLLYLLGRHASVGDALALAQCFGLAHRTVTDAWLDATFRLPGELRGLHSSRQSYRQLLNAVFVSGAFFCGLWSAHGGPFNDGTCFVESSAYVDRVAGSRLLQMKLVNNDYGDGYADVCVGEGRGVAEVVGGDVFLNARGATIVKTRLRDPKTTEQGLLEVKLLASPWGPPQLRLTFGGVQDLVRR